MANRKTKIKNDDNRQNPRANFKRFYKLKEEALIITWGIFAIAFNREYFVKVCQDFPNKWESSTLTEMAIFFAPIILFLELAVLVIRWMYATNRDLDMWGQWLGPADAGRKEEVAFFTLALILGILPAFPNHIIIISGVMTIYSSANLWTLRLAKKQFTLALKAARGEAVNKTTKEVLAAMEHFWLKRPQLARIKAMIFLNFVALSLALVGRMEQEPERHRLRLSAYAVLILALLASEIVIAWWRHPLEQIVEAAEQNAKNAHKAQ